MAADPQDAANDLDEDLFDFPIVAPFGAPKSAASPDGRAGDDLFGEAEDDGEHGVRAALESNGALEEDIDRLTDEVSGMIEEDDLDRYLEDTRPAASPKSDPAPPKSTAHAEPSAPVLQPATDPIVAATIPAPAPAPTAAAGRTLPLGRTGMLLLAGAALFAIALLGVVWSASRGVQQALTARTAPATPQDDALQTRIAELEVTLAAQREELLTALAQRETEDPLPGLPEPADVEPAWSVERTLIQEALADGRYREARRRLWGLQAVLDDLDATVAAELAPTIAFLIPETYRLQAQGEGGKR